MRYSVQPRDGIFMKHYGFLSFVKNMVKKISKNISKNLSDKRNRKPLGHTKQFATYAIKIVSKRAIKKTAEATGDIIGNKIADRITNVSKV